MTVKFKAKLQEAAKKFCMKTDLPPDVIITSTKYSLAGLIAFHAGAEWALSQSQSPESDPSNPVVDEGWISECKEVIELLLKRNRELYSFADMPWEDYSGQNAVVRGKEFVNRLPKPPNT